MMMISCCRSRFLAIAFTLVAIGPWSHAGGAVVIEYTFSGNLNPTVTASGITGFAVTGGSGNPGLNADNWGYTTDPVLRVTDIDVTTRGTAIDNDMYFEFGLNMGSAEPGLLHGTILSLDAGRGGSGTPRGFAIASSADSFTTILLADAVPTVRPTFTSYAVALNDAMFQNLAGDVTFRVYVYTPNSGSSLEFDNIRIAGAGEGTWFGGGGDNHWSTAANWATGGVPTSSNSTTVTLGTTQSAVSVQDLTDPFLLIG